MISTLFKTIIWSAFILMLPIVLFVLYVVGMVAGPIIVVVLAIFLPFILIGSIMGYHSGKSKFKD